MKTCPFCGRELIMLKTNQSKTLWFVVCLNCGVRGPEALEPKTAQRLWDIRKEAK